MAKKKTSGVQAPAPQAGPALQPMQPNWPTAVAPGQEPLFDWLTGGVPRSQFDRFMESVLAGTGKSPFLGTYDPTVDPDKIQHAEVERQITKERGAPAAFAAGIGQEAITGLPAFIQALAENPIPGRIGAGGVPTLDPSFLAKVFGPQGFNLDDLVANMRGIQMQGANQNWKQFLMGGK